MIEKTGVKQTFSISSFFFLICVLWINGGVIRFSKAFNAIILIAFFAMGLLFMFVDFTYVRKNVLSDCGYICGIFFLMTILPTSILLYKSIDGESSKVLYALILLAIQLYLRRKGSYIAKIFVFAILIDSIIINIKTIITLATSEDIARIYASGSDAVLESGFDIYLLGGYGYIYSLVFALIFLVTEKNEIKDLHISQRIIVWVYAITSIITIIEAQYTIAILALIIWSIFALATKSGFNAKTIISALVLIILFIFVGKFLIEYSVKNNIFGRIVTDRLSQLLGLSSGQITSGSDLESRKDLYLKTLKYLPKCFFFGTYETSEQANLLLGWHTEWFDRLARFGIIRYSFFVAFLIKSIKYSLPASNKHGKYLAYITCLIFLGIVNPILTNNFYLIMFIFIPFVFSNDKSQEINNEKNIAC